MTLFTINEKQKIKEAYKTIRNITVSLCAPLAIEDYVIQTIEDTSPPKWHLAHTTWFFETFILALQKKYKLFDKSFNHLFNSYYHGKGKPFPRHQRGILSRPTVETILKYRTFVDENLLELIDSKNDEELKKILPIIILGLNHEEQHQELLLMDIKHNFSMDPGYPSYKQSGQQQRYANVAEKYVLIQGGLVSIGYSGDNFCFDNELPLHEFYLKTYLMSNRLVNNGEYLEFIEAKGYQQFQWWLADGYEYIRKHQYEAPLYWQKIGNDWYTYTLHGLKKIVLEEPVAHISYYEADAYAKWKNKRLLTEMEWEYAVNQFHLNPQEGNYLENLQFHPEPAKRKSETFHQTYGDLWEWTRSAYLPYPGFKEREGAVSEYNGKFMNNQIVLRGGSCITPKNHMRASYRNFFQAEKRWQFSGIRLADDIK